MYNSNLEVCDLPNFCTYLSEDPSTHPRTIYGNLGTCYDQDAVVTKCNAPVYDCPTLEKNINDVCQDAEGNDGIVDADCECYVEPYIDPCPTGDIVFNHQDDIEDFLIAYPNCTEISGSLTIEGEYFIENLDGLSSLTSIGGYLGIYENSQYIELGKLLI